MKRCCVILAVMFLAVSSGLAAETAPLPKDLEETLELLKSRFEDFRTDLDDTRKLIEGVKTDVAALRGQFDQYKASNSVASIHWVKQSELQEAVNLIQEKFEKQNEVLKQTMLDAVSKLGEKLTTTPPPPVVPMAATSTNGVDHPTTDGEASAGEDMVHTVKKDEILGTIIQSYNDMFKSNGLLPIKQADVMKLNPGLNPDKLIVGQKIRIPVPAKP